MKPVVRLAGYLVYILLVGFLFHYCKILTDQMKLSSFYLYLFLQIAYPVFIGILLGLIGFTTKLDKENLEYDWVMVLGLGIPFFYYVLSLGLFWNNIHILLLPYSFDHPLPGVIFGYVLLSAFKGNPIKKKRKPKQTNESGVSTT